LRNLTKQELVQCELSILIDIDEFCKQNGLTYFLSGGTLLGAVRHQGFIPWDDDIDLMMPRVDYDRFLAEYSSPNFLVYSLKTHPSCRFPFAKVYDSRTVVAEGALRGKVEFGVFVDIFPLDVAPNSSRGIKKQVNRSLFYQQLLKIKLSSPGEHWNFRMNVMIRIAKLFLICLSESSLSKRIDTIARSSSHCQTTHMGCMVWGYREKEILETNAFASAVPMKFENLVFLAPRGYHEYLSSLYGDYMKLPPKEKQVSKHDFEAYWIEE